MTTPRPTWLLGPLAILAMTVLATSGARAVPIAGSQGTDTALPPTDSQVTVQGRGEFANLAITVNQTDNLTDQAVSITWTGGQPTVSGPGRFGRQYLQIMQCWGDDDGTVAANPGPPPEQCEQGAVAGTYGGVPAGVYPAGFALSRVISRSDWANFDANVGVLDTRDTNVWLPFRSVDGTVVNIQTDPTFNPAVIGGHFWLNPFYNIITTNEIAGAVTGPDGTGAELFSVVTGVQSSGLGCGQKVQPVAGGGKKVPQCWIVVVPRGTPAEENVGTPWEGTIADQAGVVTSPVSPAAWQHRIAIPISFNPVDSPCALGADERRLSGSEVAYPAVASWQPSLCANGDLPPYSYAPVPDGSARLQLLSKAPGAPGMVVVSQPIPPTAVDPANPVVYAPLTVSGLVIGFNIERNPRTDAPPEEQQLAGVRIADLNLTPRLLAKLLTQSYRGQVNIQQPPPYAWTANNPAHMGLDPDFLQFNPEYALLQTADTRTFGGLQLPEGSSDAAQQLWDYVLADPEARAWLDGQPDPWGMKVNPVYATTAAANTTGLAFADPLPNSFPKADPYCYQAPKQGSILPPPLCGTDWMPYKGSLAQTAQVTRAAADLAKIDENPFAQSASDIWATELPQYLGRRGMLALTDTPSASLYGLQMARLSRAGDNGPDRVFVAPDAAGLTAGLASMAPKAEPTVLEPTPTASAPGAYPLTTITYAAIAPLVLDSKARSEYAAFLDYAAGPGQVPGLALGQLPRGYAPLSDALKAQTTATGNAVRTMVPPPPPPTTTTEPTTEVPTTQASSPPVKRSRPKPTATTVPTTTAPPTTDLPTTTTTPPTTVAPTTTAPPANTTTTPPTTTTTVVTPGFEVAGSRFAVPGVGVAALGSALGALELTKRPRRRRTGGTDDDALLGDLGED
ncbi:MAG: hypothetical protein ACXWBO_05520 [Ilumatobacteraceae bacterium]